MSVSPSAISRVTGVTVNFKNFNTGNVQMLQQRLAVIGVGNHGVTYTTEKYECQGNASEIGDKYGYGSPLYLAALQLFPLVGKGAGFPVTFYPLAEGSGAVQATGKIEIEGTATEAGSAKIVIGGQKATIAIASGETKTEIFAKIKDGINGVLAMPVTAANGDDALTLTSKAAGEVGNLIKTRIECAVNGLTFTVTQLANGVKDPDVTPALDKIGEIWETAILPCFDYKNTDRLDTTMLYCKGRIDDLEKKPVLCYWGCTDDYATRTAVTDARPDDWCNPLLVSVGSSELPYVVGAKFLVDDILTTANENPAQGYKGKAEGLEAGDDSLQENYNIRNASVMKGSSTNIKSGNVAELNDVVTMYHPASEGKYPSRRYVVDIIKLMNVIYNVRLIMEADELKGAPLIEDSTVTSNKTAIQPKTVKTWFLNLAKNLADKAIIQDVETTKNGLEVAIDSENPKRLNVTFPVKLSGNVEVTSTDIYFGFYVGK